MNQLESTGDRTGGPVAQRHSTFVHDFVPLAMPLDRAAVNLLTMLDPHTLAGFVADACNCETTLPPLPASPPGPDPQLGSGRADAVWRAGPIGHRPMTHEDVMVWIGSARHRHDAVVLPITWQPLDDSLGVPLEADLEIASYGTNRSHLHVLGRAQLGPDLEPATSGASRYGRVVVAVVRHVLDDLAIDVFGQADVVRCQCPARRGHGAGVSAPGPRHRARGGGIGLHPTPPPPH